MQDEDGKAQNASLADIAAVMEKYGLKKARQICFFTDAELLRTPGIGRAKFARIRADYPYDELAHETFDSFEQSERLKKEQIFKDQLAAKEIWLGYIHDVRAVQFIDQRLIVARHGAPHYHAVDLIWDRNVPDEERLVSGCFGPELSLEDLKDTPAFPTLNFITSVALEEGSAFDYFRTVKVRIRGGSGTFWFDLFLPNGGESPLGEFLEERFTRYDIRSELTKDPLVAAARKRARRALELAGRASFLGKMSAALKAYARAGEDVVIMLSEAQKLADIRGVTIRHESFGLTAADVDAIGSNLRSDDVLAESLFQPFYEEDQSESPMGVVQSIMRTLVDNGDEKAVTKAVATILDTSPWMGEEQRSRLRLCLVILEEFKAIRRDVERAGVAGIFRKAIVDGVNERHPTDGGMARRAVLRWLYGSPAGIIKVSTPKGVVFRGIPAE